MTRQPRLLDSSMREVARLLPTAMSLDLDLEGISSASITLAEDAPDVAMHDWIEVYSPDGSAGIFRVTNIDDTKRGERVLTLMHALDTLSDCVWSGATDYSGTVNGFLSALIAQQAVKRWRLGDCEDTAQYKRSGINYDKLGDLLNEVRESEIDYYFEFNFSTSPWTLSFRQRTSAVASEFRLARNVENCRITYSDAEMCNRLYLSVNKKIKNDDTDVTTTETEIKTYNNTQSQTAYGLIEKTADIDLEDVPSADAWAQKFLRQRAEPSVQISIDGFAWKQLTGVDFDAAKLGKIARVALPDYGQTFAERVVSIHYPELLFEAGQVERVTVELANRLPKFSESIASIGKETAKTAKAGRGAARGGASASELESWSVITKHHGDVLDDTGVSQLYESGIEVDAQEGVTIYSLIQGFTSQYSAIKVNANAITAEVSRATNEEGTLRGLISVEAGRIGLLVEGSGSSASIKLDAITDGINNAGSTIYINASKILLDGETIANKITGIEAYFSGNATANKILTNRIDSGNVNVLTEGTLNVASDATFKFKGNEVSWKSKSVVTSGTSVTRSDQHFFVYAYGNDLSDLRTVSGRIITNYSGATSETLYYLGREPKNA